MLHAAYCTYSQTRATVQARQLMKLREQIILNDMHYDNGTSIMRI